MKTILNFIKKNRNIILLIISFVFLTMLVLGMTYAYFDLKTNGETSSTMKIGGAEITATYSFNNIIYVDNIIPTTVPISYKDITVTYKNTSSQVYNLYLKAVIDYNSFIDKDNDGVLYYEIYSGNNYETLIQSQTIFPTIVTGKSILKEIPIPANSSGTIAYRIKLYFPKSNKFQNKIGRLTLNCRISVENDNSLNYEQPSIEIIQKLYQASPEINKLEEDDTPDKNIRYLGSNPSNYLKFNDEIWRIVGLFNVYNNDRKTTEQLMKIVRQNSLGKYSWDSSDSTINSGYGINEWGQSKIMTELNSDYLNESNLSGTTTWYNGKNNQKDGEYNYNNSIKSKYRNYIANVKWYSGSVPYETVTAIDFYNYERGTTQLSNPSDGVPRKNTWDGKIGLIYGSDFGYASSDKECRKSIRNNVEYWVCKNNNWIFDLISSQGDTHILGEVYPYIDLTYYVSTYGYIYTGIASQLLNVNPVIFLKSDVSIKSGDGTINNPYLLT